MNRTITERACSIKLQADMAERFWEETLIHASYLINMSPFTTVDLQISEEIWRRESVNYSILQVFDCPAYSLVDSQQKNKL